MPQAVVLMHEVGGHGWETKKVKSAKGGLIDLRDIKSLLGIRMAGVLRLGPDYMMLFDEKAGLTGAEPSVGLRMRGRVEVILGAAVLVRVNDDGVFLGLSAEDEFKLQTGVPWCSPAEAG